MARRRKKKKKTVSSKYRSGFEEKIAISLTEQKVKFDYETVTLDFIQPEVKRTYTPDFILPNGIIVEAKGKMDLAVRKKMVLVKEQYPDLDIRFVFQRPNNKIRKGSKTTYADWAEKNGFLWAEKKVPDEWLI